MAERSIWEQAYGRLTSPDFAAPSQAVQSVRNPSPMVGRGGVSSYDFSWRDMTRQWLKSLGLSDSMVNNTMTLADFTPAGAAFAGNEARRSYNRGERVAPAAEVALAALPLPAAVKKGASKVAREVAEEAPRTIIAYHGSPHSFDRFDMSKIGTGEGAQAYGHGLYFAENEGVARSYRDALNQEFKDVLSYAGPDRSRNAASMLAADLSEADILEGLEILGDANPRASLEAGRRLVEKAKSAGSMYQVRIDADPADFLDWDAPLSGQSEKVRAAVRSMKEGKLELSHDRRANGSVGYTATVDGTVIGMPNKGEVDFRQGATDWTAVATSPAGRLLDRVERNPRAATEKLRQAGIPGIKYLDQSSRTAGDGSRNYVVFDDKLITILKKYGWVQGMAIPAIAVRDYTAMYGVAPDLGGEAPTVTVY